MKICVIGLCEFGQFLSKTFVRQGHSVIAASRSDYRKEAASLGVSYCSLKEIASHDVELDVDVILLAVSILSFCQVLHSLPQKILENRLIVDVLSVKAHPKTSMLAYLPPSSCILCTHPMFGPVSARDGWDGQRMQFERVRIHTGQGLEERCSKFLQIFFMEGCVMVEMPCEQHDDYAANSQFVTHLTGRVLGQLKNFDPTPIDTQGFRTLLGLRESYDQPSGDDLFDGMYVYNSSARNKIAEMRSALDAVEARLLSRRDQVLRKQVT